MSALKWLPMIAVMALSHSSFCAEYELFSEPGKAVPHYDQIVGALKEGDVVRFSNGKTFPVLETRRGNVNMVIRTAKDHAIRIPLSAKEDMFRGDLSLSIQATHDSMKDLKRDGVRIVPHHFDEYLPREYIGVDWIDMRFTYSQFLDLEKRRALAPELYQKALDDLVEFSRSTWRYRNIGDLRADQLGYSDALGWVLFDATPGHGTAMVVENGDIFRPDHLDMARDQMAAFHDPRIGMMTNGGKLPLPRDSITQNKIRKVILDERVQHGLPHSFCGQIGVVLRRWLGKTQ